MEELSRLVVRSQSGDVDAYGQIVGRFQDMAYGYAYSLLGDFHLAEDAAQEAFLEAYRKMDALKRAEAFPGWFRRTVWSQCQRELRRAIGKKGMQGRDLMKKGYYFTAFRKRWLLHPKNKGIVWSNNAVWYSEDGVNWAQRQFRHRMGDK